MSPAHLLPDMGKVSTDRVKQQALVRGFNSLVKSIRQCQRLWFGLWGMGEYFLEGFIEEINDTFCIFLPWNPSFS